MGGSTTGAALRGWSSLPRFSGGMPLPLRRHNWLISSCSKKPSRFASLVMPVTTRQMSTTAKADPSGGGAAGMAEPWQELLRQQGRSMEHVQQQRRNNLATAKPKGVNEEQDNENVERKLVCPVCSKPNILTMTRCSACNFPLTTEDVALQDTNPFLSILKGHQKNESVHYRDDRICIFDDKFATAKHHVDCIPAEPIVDITQLRRHHIPLLQHMFDKGLEVLRHKWQQDEALRFRNLDVNDYLVVGFNFPVSVRHLHLHMLVLPLRHTDCFKHPRFNPYDKVVADLKKLKLSLSLSLSLSLCILPC
ncbi:hypothetical protein QOT17_021081 [Balamuthia mandrillaris]